MSFTLELFEPADVALVLADIRRVIRPTGRLGVVAMAESASSNAMIDAYKWLHRHFPHFVDCRPINVVDLSNVVGSLSWRHSGCPSGDSAVLCVVGVR